MLLILEPWLMTHDSILPSIPRSRRPVLVLAGRFLRRRHSTEHDIAQEWPRDKRKNLITRPEVVARRDAQQGIGSDIPRRDHGQTLLA